MWGSSTGAGAGAGGSGGLADSANAHYAYGAGASQVNAAQAGALLPMNVTIMSIGAQNIISVTGDNNDVTGNQSASSNGNISTKSEMTVVNR